MTRAKQSNCEKEEKPINKLAKAYAHNDAAYLIEALTDTESRIAACRLLGRLKPREAIEPLTRLLRASDPFVRCEAINALSALRAVSAVGELRNIARTDEKYWVRLWAIEALFNIDERTGAEEAIYGINDEDWRVRRESAAVIARTGDQKLLPVLLKARGIEGNRYCRRSIGKAIKLLEKRAKKKRRSTK
jgi:HEAT repeat protein